MLREFIESSKYHIRSTREFARHDFTNAFEKTLRDIAAFDVSMTEGTRVLDLGCGQRFPFALLASTRGASVTALDVNYTRADPWPLYFMNILRTNGIKRALRSSFRRFLFDGLYYRELEKLCGVQLETFIRRVQFVTADPYDPRYPLPDNSFDIIASNAVLEHVSDVGKYFREVGRLLNPGGIFYAIIHNFYSLSGGHNLEWAFPDRYPSKRVPPWDHLRGNQFPAHVFLNKLKPAEYERLASEALEILLFEVRDINHNKGGEEGARFLTPEIHNELEPYPRDLLLARSHCMICRKKPL